MSTPRRFAARTPIRHNHPAAPAPEDDVVFEHGSIDGGPTQQGLPDDTRHAERRRVLGRRALLARSVAAAAFSHPAARAAEAVLLGGAGAATGYEAHQAQTTQETLNREQQRIAGRMVAEAQTYVSTYQMLLLANHETPDPEDDIAFVTDTLNRVASGLASSPAGASDPLLTFKRTLDALTATRQADGSGGKTYRTADLFAAAGMASQVISSDYMNDQWANDAQAITQTADTLRFLGRPVWRMWQTEGGYGGPTTTTLTSAVGELADDLKVDLSQIGAPAGQIKGGGSPELSNWSIEQAVTILAQPLLTAAEDLDGYVTLTDAQAAQQIQALAH